MTTYIRRREFIFALGGAAAAATGLFDAVARVRAEPMRKVLGRPVVIDPLLS
jgi:tripartite-type tricarboxylate transporter receptor subunit TctC